MNENDFKSFVGQSRVMKVAYDALARMAQSKAPVMICGETGTGKELAAQALHRQGPFIAINCAAIPNELLESEIFGHVKGAFTGASVDRMGAAMQADGGTLFLDEVTEMPLALQAKLLRFIQTGVFRAVGGTQSVKVDIRFISTTNRDVQEAITQGRLRQDLYYRLAVLRLSLPPLRGRGGDIVLLADYFLEKICTEEKKTAKVFTGEALGAMTAYDWRGNVRELGSVIRNAVVMHDGAVVEASMLGLSSSRTAPLTGLDIRPFSMIEREEIERAVGICGGNITEAARQLGLNPSTIHRKRKEWGSLTQEEEGKIYFKRQDPWVRV